MSGKKAAIILFCFVSLLPVSSCITYDEEAARRAMEHQLRAGERINSAQENSKGLFDELE